MGFDVPTPLWRHLIGYDDVILTKKFGYMAWDCYVTEELWLHQMETHSKFIFGREVGLGPAFRENTSSNRKVPKCARDSQLSNGCKYEVHILRDDDTWGLCQNKAHSGSNWNSQGVDLIIDLWMEDEILWAGRRFVEGVDLFACWRHAAKTSDECLMPQISDVECLTTAGGIILPLYRGHSLVFGITQLIHSVITFNSLASLVARLLFVPPILVGYKLTNIDDSITVHGLPPVILDKKWTFYRIFRYFAYQPHFSDHAIKWQKILLEVYASAF